MEQEDPTDAPRYPGRRNTFLQMQRLLYKFIKEQTLILKMVFEDFIQLVPYVNV